MSCLEVALPERAPSVAAELAQLEDDAKLAINDVACLVDEVVRRRIPKAHGENMGVADVVDLFVAGLAVDLLKIGGEISDDAFRLPERPWLAPMPAYSKKEDSYSLMRSPRASLPRLSVA